MRPCRRVLLSLALSGFLGAPPASASEAFSPDLQSYVWDAPLYADQRAWDQEREHVESGIAALARYQGQNIESASALADALDAMSDLRGRAARMAIHGTLMADLDSSVAASVAQYDAGTALEIRVETAVEPIEAAVRALGAETLTSWLAAEPRLVRHQRRINRILFDAPHTPKADAAGIVETMARWPRLAGDTYATLMGSDIGWPTVTLSDGTSAAIDSGAYIGHLRALESAGDRELMQTTFLGRLSALQDSFGLLYSRRVEADLTIAQTRGFASGIDALWYLRDGMPEGSVRTMIAAVRAQLPMLRDYVALRSRARGTPPTPYAGLLLAAPPLEMSFAIDDTMRRIVDAFAPAGLDFQTRASRLLHRPWLHLAYSDAKSADWGVYQPVGGAHAYGIMNYRTDFRTARNLAGAAMALVAYGDPAEGGVMFDSRDDPPIYGNALVYVGGFLHDAMLLREARDDAARAAVIVRGLDQIVYTYFRYALFAELEAEIEAAIVAGHPLGGAEISAAYLRLLREYYGESVDARYASEWMLQAVPFYSYEHHFWVAAMAAAAIMTDRLERGDENATLALTGVLGRGELDLSYHLLRDAGIHMDRTDAYDAIGQRMQRAIQALEGLTAPASP